MTLIFMTNEIFAALLPMCDETLCSHYFTIALVENFKKQISRVNYSSVGQSVVQKNPKVVGLSPTRAITIAILFIFAFVKYTSGTHCRLVSNFGHFAQTGPGPYSTVRQSVVLITPRS